MTANGTSSEGPVGQEKINTDIVTLTRFLTEEQAKHKEATGDFTYAASQTSTSWHRLTGDRTDFCAMLCSSRSRVSPTTSAGRR